MDLLSNKKLSKKFHTSIINKDNKHDYKAQTGIRHMEYEILYNFIVQQNKSDCKGISCEITGLLHHI